MKILSLLSSLGVWMLVTILCLLINDSVAQVNSLQISNVDAYIAQEGLLPEDRLNMLLSEQFPTIVFANGEKFFPESQNAQVLHIDGASIDMINTFDERFRTVKLLTIIIVANSDKSGVRLSASLLENFRNLEYVFINAQGPLSKSEVESIVAGLSNSELIVLYKSEIPQ